jgi:hypothetical protein
MSKQQTSKQFIMSTLHDMGVIIDDTVTGKTLLELRKLLSETLRGKLQGNDNVEPAEDPIEVVDRTDDEIWTEIKNKIGTEVTNGNNSMSRVLKRLLEEINLCPNGDNDDQKNYDQSMCFYSFSLIFLKPKTNSSTT